MQEKSLRKNATWNIIYTGSNLLFPLIIAPYVNRVLGASQIGKVDFAQSFVQWFVIFSAFGITTYGVRAISQVRNDKSKLNKVFSELFTINFIFSCVSSLIYGVVIINSDFFLAEIKLFYIMIFSIVLNVVNIDWFYQGIEEYSYITVRNFIIKVISVLLIFTLINSEDDYLLYALISLLGAGLSGVLNLFNSRRYVSFVFKNLKFKKHIISLSIFFSMTFIVNVYTNLDKTLLGFMSTSSSVAFLSRSKMVVSIGTTMSSSISAVAMPRASYYLMNDKRKFNTLIGQIPNYLMILTIPVTFGIGILSKEIMFLIGGIEFYEARSLLAILSIVTIFSSLSTFIQQQILIPHNKEKYGLISSALSGGISLFLNFILIPKFDYIGSAIAVITAEFVAFLSRLLFAKKLNVRVNLISNSIIKYFVASIIMCLPILVVKSIFNSYILIFFISAIVGGLTYFTVLLILRENILYYFIEAFLKKLKK